MANISSYDQLSSWNEDDDLLFVQQPDAPKKAHPSQVKQYVEAGDFEATGEIKDGHGNILADVVTAVNKKITLIEHKRTTSGNYVKFDTPLDSDVLYAIAVSGPVTATSRRLRFSLVALANNSTSLNEVYIGNTNFTLSVDADRCVTVTASGINSGIITSLIKLQ